MAWELVIVQRRRESFAEKFKPKPGSWNCDTCLVCNPPGTVKCLACATTKPGAALTTQATSSTPSQPQPAGASGGFMFGGTISFGGSDSATPSQTSSITFGQTFGGSQPPTTGWFSFGGSKPTGGFSFGGESTKVASSTQQKPLSPAAVATSNNDDDKRDKTVRLSEMFKPKSGAWSCPTCYCQNSAEHKKCPACLTCQPGAQPEVSSSFASSTISSSFKFGNASLGQLLGKSDSSGQASNTAPTQAGATSPATTSSFGQSGKSLPQFSFGGGDVSGAVSNPPASGSGGFMFGSNLNQNAAEEQALDLSLPKTSDQGCKFSEMAKSFTFQFKMDPEEAANAPPKSPTKSPGIQRSPDLMKSPSLDKSGDDSYYKDDDYDGLFEPVVHLHPVELTTGEENEDVMFCHRAKLYQFNKETNEWKERGMGDIKIMKHKETGLYRILMRREQVLKLCANHFIQAEMSMRPHSCSDRSWVWTAVDASDDGNVKPELLAVRFKTSDVAVGFKEAFENAKETVIKIKGSNQGCKFSEMAKSFAFQFKMDPEEAANALPKSPTKSPGIQRSPGLMKSPSLDKSGDDSYYKDDDCDGLHFEPVVHLDPVELTTGEENEDVMFCHRAKLYRFNKETNEWKERGMGDVKIMKHKETGLYRILMRREQVLKLCANHFIQPELAMHPKSGSDRSWVWTAMDASDDGNVKPELLAVRFKTSDVAVGFKEAFENAKEAVIKIKGSNQGCKFSDMAKSFTFQFKMDPEEAANAPPKSMTKSPGIQRSPGLMKSQSLDKSRDDSYYKDDDYDGLHFEPVVHFDPVELTTGEENEDVMFYHRAKLYRFNKEVNEWKERGMGDIKIMKHKETGLYRILMRRERVLKLCANHFIQPEMDLRPNSGSDRSWVWTAMDASDDGNVKPELLAVRLKTSDVAVRFKEAFENAKEAVIKIKGSNQGCKFSDMAKSFTFQFKMDPEEAANAPPKSMTKSPGIQRSPGLMKSPSLDKSGDDSYYKDDDYDGLHFEPVVHLDPVELTTGEENEDVMFCHRAKLYRFNKEVNEWKERGMGDIKIMKHKETGLYRILMRRERVLKLCANHFIQPEMDLRPNSGSDRSWVWTAMDASDGNVKPELLAVRFKASDVAVGFKEAFENANEAVIKIKGSNQGCKFSDMAKSFTFQFKMDPEEAANAPPKSMTKSPGIQRSPGLMKSPSLDKSGDDSYYKDDDYDGLHFEPVVHLDPVELTTGEENEDVMFCHRAKLYRFNKETNEWKERGMGDIKIMKHKETGLYRILMRRERVLKLCANHFIQPEMDLRPNSGSDRSWVWTAMDASDDGNVKPELLAVRFKTSDVAVGFKEAFENAKEAVIKIKGSNQGCKFSDMAKSFTFQFKMDPEEAANAPPKSMTKSPGIQRSPGLMRSPSLDNSGDDSYYKDDDYDGLHFEPVVHLDPVELTTGEENEDVMFYHRAKLYRFNKEVNEWKERGVGDIKIMKHKETGLYRILMRRERVLKLCANHFIQPEMDLRPNSGSDRSWVWTAMDASDDGNVKPELLAVRFKASDVAVGFKEAFENAKEAVIKIKGSNQAKPAEKEINDKSKEVKNDDTEKIKTDQVEKKITEEKGDTQVEEEDNEEEEDEDEEENEEEDEEEEVKEEEEYKEDEEDKLEEEDKKVEDDKEKDKTQVDSAVSATSALKFSFGQSFAAAVNKTMSEDEKNEPNTASSPAKASVRSSDQGYYPEEERDDLQFEPVVTLKEIEVKTVEVEEEQLFCQRAKLYHWNRKTKQWKDRGVGEIKILKHTVLNRCRVLMRRDQVLKICANHIITPEMELKAHAGSDKSLAWIAMDVSDMEPQMEMLAVKFKTAANTADFKSVFEKCQGS